MRGTRGSDWVLPGTASLATRPVAAVRSARTEAAAAGSTDGSARAAAQVTPSEVAPIEEVRNPRMLMIMDIVIQICPSVN
ncbi:hypothetical protein Scel_55360 [Streptomyces cellostaticus]|nr:hypothetical protein Scel_55360 [Streptomyces cellostaticus]